MRYTIQPTAADATRQRIGGKAAALASLQQAGFLVPDWLALVPAACDDSLDAAARARLAAACEAGDDAAVRDALARLAPSAAVLAELTQAVAALAADGQPLAVRSSASEEDGAARSFAGQLASFLDVTAGDVAARVADVWRSGFSARILAYRRTHTLDALPPAPAVLIQRMVAADVSGVAFSADAASGRRGVAIVSAVAGLGEALVSGASEGETARVDRLDAIERINGDRQTPLLDDDQLREVAELARRCERHFGVPQDIEWAIAGGQVYLLQSRPITTLAGMRDPDGAYALWDNSNIAESYGGVTTPLTFSFACHAYEEVYRELCRLLGVSESEIAAHADTFRRMIGLARGRIYYSLFSWYDLLSLAPGFSANRRFMEQMMGVKEELPPALAARLATNGGRMRPSDALKVAWAVIRLLRHYRRLPRDIERFYARLDAALAPGAIPLEAMRPDELVAHYRDLEGKLLAHWDAPLVNDLFAMLFYGLLRRLCSAWLGDAAGTLQNDLVGEQGGVISAEPARRVRELAHRAGQSPSLTDMLRTGSPAEMARAIAQHPAFAHEYQAYLAKFADRCLEELKLESPTLRDDPTPLLRAIGHLAHRFALETSVDADATASAAIEPSKRTLAERIVRRRLKFHPLRRLLFGYVLAQARLRVRDRENLRFERTRVFGRVRRIVVELGRRFHALGLLENPRDIFYLEIEEALGYVMGTATTSDLKGLVAVRQAEYAHWRASEPPPDRFETRGLVPVGPFTPRLISLDDSPPASDHVGQRSGIGCCPGVVRGRARVVTDPKTAEVRAGEILVAERTDPGWILLFAGAAGVVVERGSVLSHSAIVARELGIPAVVSVPGLTSWLKTGDLIEVNGAAGVVTRLSDDAPSFADTTRETSHAHL
ncbi:MAG TPA: PEP/pyruvate-binding domain-containing protein [Ktedonobacterales bacterium]|nr:PEP/pyruvate-binding domain-containing protein [Ktedonobacterales bacterium]